MSRENVEFVRAAYHAVVREDWDAAAPMFQPAVTVVVALQREFRLERGSGTASQTPRPFSYTTQPSAGVIPARS